jgi:hypothetical protein
MAHVSWLVAIMLSLCVPFGQLQTVADRIECCCPDPSTCKCPDHKADHSGQPQMRACHKTTHKGLAHQLAVFVPPTLHETIALAPLAQPVSHRLPTPHAEPPPQRPDAPS